MVDGEANGAAVKLNARLDGGATDGARDVRILPPPSIPPTEPRLQDCCCPTAPSAAPDSGRVLIKATGVPDEGLTTLASFDAGDVALELPRAGDACRSGHQDVGRPRLPRQRQRAACRAGRSVAAAQGGRRADQRQAQSRLGETAASASRGLRPTSAQAGWRDTSTLSRTADRRRIDASLDTDDVSVARLLAPLLDQRLAIAGAAEAAISGRQSVWPDEPFSAAAFDALEGNHPARTAGRLVLADGIALEGAKLDIALDAGKIDIEDISGKGLGGQFKAKLQIAQGAGRRRSARHTHLRRGARSLRQRQPAPGQRSRERHAWNSRGAA